MVIEETAGASRTGSANAAADVNASSVVNASGKKKPIRLRPPQSLLMPDATAILRPADIFDEMAYESEPHLHHVGGCRLGHGVIQVHVVLAAAVRVSGMLA